MRLFRFYDFSVLELFEFPPKRITWLAKTHWWQPRNHMGGFQSKMNELLNESMTIDLQILITRLLIVHGSWPRESGEERAAPRAQGWGPLMVMRHEP